MEIVNKVIADINQAKEQILRELISKIEGRPALDTDAENLILARHPPHIYTSRERVIYKNVQIGDLEVSIEKMTVSFIPIIE